MIRSQVINAILQLRCKLFYVLVLNFSAVVHILYVFKYLVMIVNLEFFFLHRCLELDFRSD